MYLHVKAHNKEISKKQNKSIKTGEWKRKLTRELPKTLLRFSSQQLLPQYPPVKCTR
jgi:hypothetical protein